MAVSGKLYTYSENYRAYKALIAAKYSGASVEVDKSFVFGETNKSAEFLKKFPLGKVPAFESKDGQFITESNAIAWYLANEQLRGKTVLDQANILKWINFAESEIVPAACTWVYPSLSLMALNKPSVEKAKEDVKKLLGILNSYLLTRTYLVGERVTLADITVCCCLLSLYKYVMEPTFCKEFVNVNRWFNTIVNQPNVKAVIGEFKSCEKMAQFDGKKYGELQGKSKAQPEKKEKKQPKQEEKKPKEKKIEESPAAETPAPPKPKDPLDALPAGTFGMDPWKRFYSNNDEDKSIEYFWENFDKEHYSIWFCEYTEDLKTYKVFMSGNLISGMFQRLDKLRKNAFASMCIFGSDYENSIAGLWVFRGQELAFTLCDDWSVDYESYKWRKLDPASDETKKLVTQFWKWEGVHPTNGKELKDGKIFK